MLGGGPSGGAAGGMARTLKKPVVLLGVVAVMGMLLVVMSRLSPDDGGWQVPPSKACAAVPKDVLSGALSKYAADEPVSAQQSAAHTHCPADCSWQFLSYEPSAMEQKWRQGVLQYQTENVCEPTRELFCSENRRWMAYSKLGQDRACAAGWTPQSAASRTHIPSSNAAGLGSGSPPAPASVVGDTALFSVFTYQCKCPAGSPSAAGSLSAPAVARVPIEPLAGALRSPEFCDDSRLLVSKDYLVVDGWAAGMSRGRRRKDGTPARSFYFDAGASYYVSGEGGASQEWFVEEYGKRCVAFDGIWAWEAEPLDPHKVWQQIPGPLKPVYHFFNTYASADETDWDSPLRHLRAVATPEDFVVFKLDIDNNEVEEAIVRSLLADPQLMALIDEMFWEHHVNFRPMAKQWKTTRVKRTMEDSLKLFDALRRGGIRVHSWV